MTLPDAPLHWADGPDAVKEDPSDSFQTNGWAVGDFVAAEHLNSLFGNIFGLLGFFWSGGLGAVVKFTTLAAMKAAVDIIPGQVAYLVDYGLYKYDEDSVASGDDFLTVDPDASGAGRWIMISRDNIILGGLNVTQGRLSLVTATPVMSTEQTAKTTIYFTPYQGNLISLYSGAAWYSIPFTEKSIKLTDAQSGATHNGTMVIDGLTDTSQLIVGMAISGTNVGGGSVIVSIDSLTQITGSVNSTGSATNTITFKVPANTALDIFAYNNSGTMKLEMVKWTNTTTRATALTTQDGIYSKTGALTRKYLGSVCTGATAGQTEWTFGGTPSNPPVAGKLLLFNYYNRKEVAAMVRDSVADHGTNYSSYDQAAGESAYQVNVMIGVSEGTCSAEYFVTGAIDTNSANISVGIGINSTSTNSAINTSLTKIEDASYVAKSTCTAIWSGFLSTGFNYVAAIEKEGTGNASFFGAAGTGGGYQTGLRFNGVM
jgi:hypothetical protein